MRARAIFTGLLVLLALTPLRAEAAPSTATLVLRGSSTASVDVRFHTPFTPHVGVFEARKLQPRVTMRGTYAGAWIERIGEPNESTGFYAVRKFDAPDGKLVMGMDPYPIRFDPGRYRITLVTDGPSEVRITVGGLTRNLTLTPRRAVSSWAKHVDVRSSPDDMAGDETITFRVRDRSRTMVAVLMDAPTSVQMTSTICLEEGTLPCPAGGSSKSFGTGDGDWSTEWWHFGVGALKPKAEQDVTFMLSAPGTEPPDDLLAFVVTFGG